MAEHLRGLGKHPRAWGSMTVMHGSSAGYDRDVTINAWNNGWYGMASALADGYEFINTNDGDLYVVPFANYYHGNGLNNSSLYSSWLPNKLGSNEVVPAGTPKGAMFAVWNDLVHREYTELDVHGLMRDSFPVIAQKTWKSTTPTLSYGDFTALQRRIGVAPGLSTIEQGNGTAAAGERSLGAVVTASSSNEGASPSALTDGRPLTRWATSEPTAEVVVDLGASASTGRIEIDWAGATPASYDVEVSTDGGSGSTSPTTSRAPPARSTSAACRRDTWPSATSVPATATSAPGDSRSSARRRSRPARRRRPRVSRPLRSRRASPSTATMPRAGRPTMRAAVDRGRSQVGPAFRGLSLKWEGASAKDYTVEVSSDAQTWTLVATRTGLAAGARTDCSPSPGHRRHLRVTVTAKNLSPYLSLSSCRSPRRPSPRRRSRPEISPADQTARMAPTRPRRR